MRRVATALAVLMVASVGCAAQDGPGSVSNDTDSVQDATESVEEVPSEAPQLSTGGPLELVIDAPDGFEVDDSGRDALVTENHLTYSFALIDGSERSRLFVSTYLLPEGVSAEGYDAQVSLILDYDDRRGNLLSRSKHSRSIVHGYTGVYRFATLEAGGDRDISQQNHYLFAGRHLIQITCQWQYDFNQIFRGCLDLVETLAYPEGWPLP
jgi:hypothetical protein